MDKNDFKTTTLEQEDYSTMENIAKYTKYILGVAGLFGLKYLGTTGKEYIKNGGLKKVASIATKLAKK